MSNNRLIILGIICAGIWVLLAYKAFSSEPATVNPTKKVNYSRMSPEQLGNLDVGITLDEISNSVGNLGHKRKMQIMKNEIAVAEYVSRIPAELPKSMKRKIKRG